ncbi:MAG: HAD family phosphatase, partial [Patescibacteria group bacterium]|nr:HAD family phosphatase [Patescibacteria group bacterium]
MIKAIIFDNHGVLCLNDNEGAHAALSRLLGLTEEEFSEEYWEIEDRTMINEISPKEQFEIFADKIKTDVDPVLIRDTAYKSYTVRPGMMDLVDNLVKDHEIGILTNFNSDFWLLEEQWQYRERFKKENIFVASEIGFVKPHKEAFEYVLKRLNVKPIESVFVDDSAINVEGAKKLGINGILFKNIKQLKKELA